MENENIRWKQRFEHFSKAYRLLEATQARAELNEAEQAGLIQFFEMTFELGWKLLKDYLEEQGFQISSPRDSIKTAFQSGLIEDGTIWLQALKDRNLTVHTYNQALAEELSARIRQEYFPNLKALYQLFHEKYHTS